MIAHPSSAQRRLSALDYEGLSHAKLTRRMTQARLPGSAKALMAEIFRAIPVGMEKHLSHRRLARRLGMSESTVSAGMALLAGEALDENGRPLNRTPFISRRWVADKGDGRAGYLICPLPPPELRAPLPPASHRQEGNSSTEADAPESGVAVPQGASFVGSINDPTHPIPLEGIGTPQTGIDLGSEQRSQHPLTTCMQQQRHAANLQTEQLSGQEPSDPASIEAASLPPPHDIPPALVELGLLPHQWRAIRDVRPSYRPDQCAVDLLKLRSRHDVRSAFAVLKEALIRGEPVYGQEEIEAHLAELRAFSQPAPSDRPAPAPAPEPVEGPRRRGRAVPPATPAIAAPEPIAPAPPPPRPSDPRARALMLDWEKILIELEPQLSRPDRDWIRQARLVELDDRAATIAAPSLIRDLLASRLAPTIQRAARAALARPIQVRFIVAASALGMAD